MSMCEERKISTNDSLAGADAAAAVVIIMIARARQV